MNTIQARSVLADKLQFHVSPEFLSIDEETELYYDGHLFPFFDKDIQKLYNASIVYFDKRPYLHLPNDFNQSTSKYVWNTRISLRKPYTVVVDYNFIRNILNEIEQHRDICYDKKYAESIQLHDNNYIDSGKIWSTWNDNLISDIEMTLKTRLLEFADKTFRYLVDDHELIYSIVSLKHAEFNVDYYVGSNNSLPLIFAFSRFVYSQRGMEWRSEIESISMLQQSSAVDFNRTITNQDGHDGHTFKFNITKGLSLKVYQKTTDHIRVELTFEGSFIKQRFHVVSFDKVYPELYRFAKDYFKEINFEGILYLLTKEISEKNSNQGSKIIDFIERFDPELLNIITNVINDQSVSDVKTIRRICSDSRLRPFFKRTMDADGNRAYSYSPFKRSKRYKRLKPPQKNQTNISVQPLPRCKVCDSPLHFARCPYCNQTSEGFEEFMKKVKDYDKEANRPLPSGQYVNGKLVKLVSEYEKNENKQIL